MQSIFLGLGFDTLTLEFWIPLDKAAAFAARCGDVVRTNRASRRELAEVVGKLMWWAPALPHARLLSRGIASASLGATSDREWDAPRPLDQVAREELALLEQIAAMEAEFVHRRAPPLLRAPALVARWRRLQQGEAFELLSGADGRGWGSPVWVSLSSDLSRLEIARSRGGAVLHIVRLGGVVHLVFGEEACALIRGGRSVPARRAALRLSFVRLSEPAVHLGAAEIAQLSFWIVSLQELTSAPVNERVTRGAVLWRTAATLYRASVRSRRAVGSS
jgi:hypothetical protein